MTEGDPIIGVKIDICFSDFLSQFFVHRWMAATYFEPLGARRAFLCYDEPALKANITIRIVHGGDYKAITNMSGKVSDK